MPTDPGMQNEIITWTDSAGNVTNLGWLWNPNDLAVIWGRKGAYMPVPVFAKYKTPFQDGALITFLNYAERQIDLTCEMFCSNITILKQRMAALLQAFRPDKPNGTLSITNEVGITRQLTCHYVDGLKGVEDLEWGAGYVGRFVIIFEAGEPFWKDPRTAAAQTIAIPADTTMGSVVSTTPVNIVNAGDVKAWPIWTFTLPFSSVINVPNGGFTYTVAMGAFQVYASIVNLTTGDYLTFYLNGTPSNVTGIATVTYTGTDTVRVVDARPSIDSIVNGSGTLVPQTLTLQNFFPLAPGNNSIRIDVLLPASRSSGIGTPNTQTFSTGTGSLSVVYQPQFLGL